MHFSQHQFHSNQANPVHNLFDQEGSPVTMKMLNEDKVKSTRQINEFMDKEYGPVLKAAAAEIESKRPAFEKALYERCERDNEIYENLGFDSRVNTILYRVGSKLHILKATINGPEAVTVGQIR